MVAMVVGCAVACAIDSIAVDYGVGLTINTGGSEFAPYYIASNCRGTVTQQNSVLLSASLKHEMDTTRRLSWGAGAEVWGGWSSSVDYQRYDSESKSMIANPQHSARLWVQQLWIEGKHRGVFLTIGQKDIDPGLVNRSLSSGDLVMSGNARAAFGARAGFINYQNVPFTRGWLQIKGEYGYYRHNSTPWLKNHFDYYNSFITEHYWFNYKNIHFRTNPSKRLVLTIGAQAACQFAGTATYYKDGEVVERVEMKPTLKAFWRALFAGSGGENMGDQIYVQGNHVGSWDISLDYKMTNGATLRAYYQSLWEEGSGIGKQNRTLDADIELRTVETNALGFTRMIGAAYRYFAASPALDAGEDFVIAAISSIAGTMGLGPAPSYSATKALQATYLEALEQQARQRGLPIHILDIRPGFVDTALLNDNFPYPMLMRPEDVARDIVRSIHKRRHVRIIDFRYRLLTAAWRLLPRWVWRRIKI